MGAVPGGEILEVGADVEADVTAGFVPEQLGNQKPLGRRVGWGLRRWVLQEPGPVLAQSAAR